MDAHASASLLQMYFRDFPTAREKGTSGRVTNSDVRTRTELYKKKKRNIFKIARTSIYESRFADNVFLGSIFELNNIVISSQFRVRFSDRTVRDVTEKNAYLNPRRIKSHRCTLFVTLHFNILFSAFYVSDFCTHIHTHTQFGGQFVEITDILGTNWT